MHSNSHTSCVEVWAHIHRYIAGGHAGSLVRRCTLRINYMELDRQVHMLAETHQEIYVSSQVGAPPSAQVGLK